MRIFIVPLINIDVDRGVTKNFNNLSATKKYIFTVIFY